MAEKKETAFMLLTREMLQRTGDTAIVVSSVLAAGLRSGRMSRRTAKVLLWTLWGHSNPTIAEYELRAGTAKRIAQRSRPRPRKARAMI